ncbi:hypothetical protein HAX54_045448 [Datura stramonium]|uniref:Uncharacterized protein n=1 Tax=Datura stramonium TaxID=4076 RepID=A0ABS8SQK1_DATST|nr:hypothetical protein [Datura stramonium]
MGSQGRNINIIATITIVLLLSSVPQEATARILKEEEEEGVDRWMRNEHLLLPSFYNPVHSPTPNPGTEGKAFRARTIEQKNFVGREKRVVVHPPPIPPSSHGNKKQMGNDTSSRSN